MGLKAAAQVTIKGVEAHLLTVRRQETETAKPCLLVHHPSDGPLCEFPATVDVANFLAFRGCGALQAELDAGAE